MWKIGKSKELLKTPIFSIEETEKTNESGTGNFVSIKAPDWVKVVIFTKSDEIILCREYRQGVNDYVWEFPSGTVEEGEKPIDAARREVEEETGRKVLSISPLFKSPSKNPNPAFMTNNMSIFQAFVDDKQGEQKLDKFEDLKPEALSLAEALAKINNQENKGGIIDYLLSQILQKIYLE